MPKSKKSRFTGSAGRAAESRRFFSHIVVTPKIEKEANVIEEEAPLVDNATYSILISFNKDTSISLSLVCGNDDDVNVVENKEGSSDEEV